MLKEIQMNPKTHKNSISAEDIFDKLAPLADLTDEAFEAAHG
jgi:hypothetical protein